MLLGPALWRARVVPLWLALGLTVSQPVRLASVLGGVRELDLVGWGLTAVGFAAAGRLLLRMQNDGFGLPPLRDRAPGRAARHPLPRMKAGERSRLRVSPSAAPRDP
ncbi:hypothetical protein ACFWOL_01160 [Streptomyces sp. NPDC058442]|uniref:hypothetical protein n=1 Tax=Streptomyces sp. NPDC058442 TaxID=3346503 RepID=UPI00364E12BC